MRALNCYVFFSDRISSQIVKRGRAVNRDVNEVDNGFRVGEAGGRWPVSRGSNMRERFTT